MADAPRARRLADRIKVIVAQTLETRIKDPRLGFVTVTDVRVTNDLQHASVFYTCLGTDEEKSATAAALTSARGVIRSEVGKGTGVRLTPTIEFIVDAVPEAASHIDDLIREAAERDAHLAGLKESARYAGESDPYRRPPEDTDDEPDE